MQIVPMFTTARQLAPVRVIRFDGSAMRKKDTVMRLHAVQDETGEIVAAFEARAMACEYCRMRQPGWTQPATLAVAHD